MSEANEVDGVVKCRACGELVKPIKSKRIVMTHQCEFVHDGYIFKEIMVCPHKRCGEKDI